MFQKNNSLVYVHAESIIHRLDPRSKMLITALLMLSIFKSSNVCEFIGLSIIVLILLEMSQIKISLYVRALLPFLAIIIPTALLQAVMAGGEPVFIIGPVAVGETGVQLAGLLIIRLVLILFIAQLLSMSTTPVGLSDGLRKILQPLEKLGFPAGELVMIISIAMHFLPLLLKEADEVKKAQISRGANFKSGHIWTRMKKQMLIIVPVFNLALQRTGDLAQAMEARAYNPRGKRSRMNEMKMQTADYIFIAAILGLTIMLNLLNQVG